MTSTSKLQTTCLKDNVNSHPCILNNPVVCWVFVRERNPFHPALAGDLTALRGAEDAGQKCGCSQHSGYCSSISRLLSCPRARPLSPAQHPGLSESRLQDPPGGQQTGPGDWEARREGDRLQTDHLVRLWAAVASVPQRKEKPPGPTEPP